MGFFEQLDMELQKDLVAFVEKQDAEKGEHTLGEALAASILRKMINGECRMSGCATDYEKKRMYVEFSFYEGKQSEN